MEKQKLFVWAEGIIAFDKVTNVIVQHDQLTLYIYVVSRGGSCGPIEFAFGDSDSDGGLASCFIEQYTDWGNVTEDSA